VVPAAELTADLVPPPLSSEVRFKTYRPDPADRLYGRQVPVVTSGVPLDRLFDEEMLSGGYRKKYRRAISRLVALNRMGVEVGNGDR